MQSKIKAGAVDEVIITFGRILFHLCIAKVTYKRLIWASFSPLLSSTSPMQYKKEVSTMIQMARSYVESRNSGSETQNVASGPSVTQETASVG